MENQSDYNPLGGYESLPTKEAIRRPSHSRRRKPSAKPKRGKQWKRDGLRTLYMSKK